MFMGGTLEQWVNIVEYFVGFIIVFITLYLTSDIITELYFIEKKNTVKKNNHQKKIFHDIA